MRLLVIEDEHKIAGTLKRGFEQERYAVDLAYDGKQGLDLAVAEEYDAIILDIGLPFMDGITICETLRKKKNHTPILILTAKGQIKERVEGLNAGADDYVVKPFAFEELLARIKAITSRPRNKIDTILQIDDLTLNTLTCKIKRGNTLIILSSTEFSLLEYLLRRKNHIVSKEQIINNVWNYDANVLPNTVEVYIGYLRSKIDKAFLNKKPLIKTIRGFGYTIEDI